MTTALSRPPSPVTLPLLDFSGGVNNSLNDEYITPNELSDAANYLPEHPGSHILRKRPGLTAISDDLAENGQLLFDGRSARYLCTLTKIQNVDGTDLDTGLTSSVTWDAASFDGADIFVNGTDRRDTTDGTTFGTVGGSMPAFKAIEEHNNFLFGVGHSLGIIRWCDLGDRDTWASTSSLTFTDDANDDMVGLAKFRDVLIAFSDKRFFHLNGFTSQDMEVVFTSHEGPGCTSNRSIVVTPAGIGWWTTQGLAWSSDGITVDLPMQRKLKGTLDILTTAQYSTVHSVWNPLHDRIEVSVPTGSTIDLKIYYYYLRDAFYLGTGTATQMNASALMTISGEPIIYVVGYSANSATDQVFSLVGDTDIAGNISAFIETSRFAPAGVSTALFRAMDLTLRTGPVPGAGNVTVGAYLEDETSIDSTNSFTVPALTTVRDYPIYFPRRISKMKVRIADALATRPRIGGVVLRGRALNN